MAKIAPLHVVDAGRGEVREGGARNESEVEAEFGASCQMFRHEIGIELIHVT